MYSLRLWLLPFGFAIEMLMFFIAVMLIPINYYASKYISYIAIENLPDFSWYVGDYQEDKAKLNKRTIGARGD